MVSKEYKIPKSQEIYTQYIDLRAEWDPIQSQGINQQMFLLNGK